MAKTLGLSQTTVGRIWQAFGLKPHPRETFEFSTDPYFAEKVRDVVGPYLNPPDRAVVLSVDEKSQVQALDRTQPTLPMTAGQAERQTHDRVRNGTTPPFAASNVAAGEVIGTCHRRRRSRESSKFLRAIDRAIPAEEGVSAHPVMGNYATHETPAVKRWLVKHRRFAAHFTPTGASWINRVERSFGEIAEKRIRRGAFKSVRELDEAIAAYSAEHNANPRPFCWTKDATLILESVGEVCERTSNSGHYWSDDAAVPPGLNRFDLSAHVAGKGGRMESYRSDKAGPVGSRFGPQNMAVCGRALQAFRADPGFYDRHAKGLFPSVPLVPFLPEGAAYAIDGRPEAGAVAFEFPGATVSAVAHRRALVLHGSFAGGELAARVSTVADEKGPHALVAATRAGGLTVKNHLGEELRFEGKVLPAKAGEPVAFEVAVPYTVRKGQGTWGNGVELGRCTLSVGGAERPFALASKGEDVRKALEAELFGGLRTWEAIFDALGYVPTGLGAGSWDRLSDSGGYAHLIAAASQYILLLDGRTDWEAHRVPAVE